MVPEAARVCYLHVGTHKTGTTSIQRSLVAGEDALFARGLYVVRSGRIEPDSGNHNLAWELGGDERFSPIFGTLASATAELAAARAPAACISSEDLESLHASPAALRRLRDAVAAAGYVPRIVIYLRPQAGYAESLYAELVRHGYARPFDAYLEALVRDGEIRYGRWRFAFDYERLVDGFAAVFGADALVVRRYSEANVSARTLLVDFYRTLDVEPALLPLRDVGRANRGLRLGDVLRCLAHNAGAPAPADDGSPFTRRALRERFDPVNLNEVERIARRFAAGNARIAERYGTWLPVVSRHDLWRDVAGSLGFDVSAPSRRRLLTEYRRPFAAS